MTIRISGLPGCDRTRAARRALGAAGKPVEFRDLRAQPPDRAELERLWEKLGGTLLNRASTTWRGLDEAARAGDPLALLAAHPALIKRPLIEGEGRTSVGWTAKQQALWLG